MYDIKLRLVKFFNYLIFIIMVFLILIENQLVYGGVIYDFINKSSIGSSLWITTIVICGLLRIIFSIILIRSFNQFFFKKATRFGWFINTLMLIIFPLVLTSMLNWFDRFFSHPGSENIFNVFIAILLPIIYLIILIGLIISNIYLKKSKITLTNEKLLMIKKTIIDLGTNFTRLEIHDVAEECNMSREVIDNALNTMINQEEVYGNYNKDTEIIEFDQDTNIKEIDNLIKKFSEWEEEKNGKKIS